MRRLELTDLYAGPRPILHVETVNKPTPFFNLLNAYPENTKLHRAVLFVRRPQNVMFPVECALVVAVGCQGTTDHSATTS